MNLKLGQTLVTLQSSKPWQIPLFAEQQLSCVKDQLKRLTEQIKRETDRSKSQSSEFTGEEKAFQSAKLALLFDQIYRIKRFLLIYYNFRCDRIEDQFWSFGGDLNNSEKGNISEAEKQYFNNYKNLVMDYVEETGVELTIDLEPPNEMEVEVRMLEDCGEILDDHGHMVKLEKHSSCYLKKRLVEQFVKQGLATIKKK